MKKLLLGAAISTALFGGTAHAVITVNADGTPTAATLADTTQIFLSGSSALQELIERSLLVGTANSICKLGTVRKYIDAPTSGSDQAAYLCELNKAAGQNPVIKTLSTKSGFKNNLLLYKRNNGGSLKGITPVTNSLPIEFLNVTSNPVAGTILAPGAFVATVSLAYSTGGAGNNTTTIPTFGLSDVNPKIFTVATENRPANDTAAFVGGYKTIPSVGAVFGVVVTTSLRKALQQVQFATNSGCHPANAGYTAAKAESADCMPSLSSKQIAAIFAAYGAPATGLTNPVKGAGKIHDWKQLKIGSSDLYTLATTKPASSKVHIVSRTIGSGTKAQFGVRFLDTACNSVAPLIVQNADYKGSSESTQTDFKAAIVPESAVRPIVHALSSAGGLGEALHELDIDANNNAGSFDSTQYPGGRWAIGYTSLDKNASRSQSYRFIKVDGVPPTLANVVDGKYHDWVEAVYLYRANLTGDLLTLVNEAINSFGKPVVLSAVNKAVATHSFGLSGFLASPKPGQLAPLNGLLNTASPVNPFSYAKYPSNGLNASDNCRVPVVYSAPSNNSQGFQLK